MQGNLNEIDIRSILQLIELGQRTGELFVETYSTPTVSIPSNPEGEGFALRNRQSLKQQSWFVFFLNGQISYVTDSGSSFSRLRDYLRRYQLEADLDSIAVPSLATDNAPEYSYLWALLEQRILTPAQGRSIIHRIVQETLFDLLSLNQGSFIFERGPALSPILTTLDVSSLVTKTMQQLQEWKQLHPYIQSPNQYLAITQSVQLRQVLPDATVNNLYRWADGKTSLRQLACYLNRDILTIARAIYPFVKHGWIQLLYPVMNTDTSTTDNLHLHVETKIPRIICISHAIATSTTIESVLKLQGYEVISCTHSLEALSLVFQLKPDLILCEITMSELDGYELCAMLRRSSLFRRTPIVMLTGKDQYIDRARARMAAATDYLTKPFADNELVMIVEKYLHLTSINFTKQKCVANT